MRLRPRRGAGVAAARRLGGGRDGRAGGRGARARAEADGHRRGAFDDRGGGGAFHAGSPGLATAKDILDRYGIDTSNIVVVDLSTLGAGRIGAIQNQYVGKLQTDTQYALDKEDNYLQQDMVSLQSYFSKRDQALSMAASLVKKVNNTMSSGIRAIR